MPAAHRQPRSYTSSPTATLPSAADTSLLPGPHQIAHHLRVEGHELVTILDPEFWARWADSVDAFGSEGWAAAWPYFARWIQDGKSPLVGNPAIERLVFTALDRHPAPTFEDWATGVALYRRMYPVHPHAQRNALRDLPPDQEELLHLLFAILARLTTPTSDPSVLNILLLDVHSSRILPLPSEPLAQSSLLQRIIDICSTPQEVQALFAAFTQAAFSSARDTDFLRKGTRFSTFVQGVLGKAVEQPKGPYLVEPEWLFGAIEDAGLGLEEDVRVGQAMLGLLSGYNMILRWARDQPGEVHRGWQAKILQRTRKVDEYLTSSESFAAPTPRLWTNLMETYFRAGDVEAGRKLWEELVGVVEGPRAGAVEPRTLIKVRLGFPSQPSFLPMLTRSIPSQVLEGLTLSRAPSSSLTLAWTQYTSCIDQTSCAPLPTTSVHHLCYFASLLQTGAASLALESVLERVNAPGESKPGPSELAKYLVALARATEPEGDGPRLSEQERWWLAKALKSWFPREWADAWRRYSVLRKVEEAGRARREGGSSDRSWPAHVKRSAYRKRMSAVYGA